MIICTQRSAMPSFKHGQPPCFGSLDATLKKRKQSIIPYSSIHLCRLLPRRGLRHTAISCASYHAMPTYTNQTKPICTSSRPKAPRTSATCSHGAFWATTSIFCASSNVMVPVFMAPLTASCATPDRCASARNQAGGTQGLSLLVMPLSCAMVPVCMAAFTAACATPDHCATENTTQAHTECEILDTECRRQAGRPIGRQEPMRLPVRWNSVRRTRGTLKLAGCRPSPRAQGRLGAFNTGGRRPCLAAG